MNHVDTMKSDLRFLLLAEARTSWTGMPSWTALEDAGLVQRSRGYTSIYDDNGYEVMQLTPIGKERLRTLKAELSIFIAPGWVVEGEYNDGGFRLIYTRDGRQVTTEEATWTEFVAEFRMACRRPRGKEIVVALLADAAKELHK